MRLAIAQPCIGSRDRVFRIRRSRVPWTRSLGFPMSDTSTIYNRRGIVDRQGVRGSIQVERRRSLPPPDLTPRPPLPSPARPPGEGAPPPKARKKRGRGFPLSQSGGVRWERGSGGEVPGCPDHDDLPVTLPPCHAPAAAGTYSL